MIRTSRYALGLLALQACSSDDTSSPPNHSLPPISAESRAELQATLDDAVANGVAYGVGLSVELPGHARWSGASGVADVETGAALTPDQRFRAGSIMKMLVATAVLGLVEDGELSLEATAAELLPAAVSERIPGAGAITVKMLLGHTSGLPEFATPEFDMAVAADPTHIWTLDELLDWALAQEPAFEPGAGWYYSNTNYVLIGEILEEMTGRPWRATVRERVFERAGMAESALPEEGDPRCVGCSRGYHPIGDDIVDVTEIDPSMAGAAGGDALITTTADLVELLGALAAGELFDDPDTLAHMRDFTDAPVPEMAQTGYGLGLQRFQLGDVELVGHLGGTAGFQGFVLKHAASGIVASGYVNRFGDLGGFIVPVLETLGTVH